MEDIGAGATFAALLTGEDCADELAISVEDAEEILIDGLVSLASALELVGLTDVLLTFMHERRVLALLRMGDPTSWTPAVGPEKRTARRWMLCAM